MSSNDEVTQPMSASDEETNYTSDNDEVSQNQVVQIAVHQFQQFMSNEVEKLLKMMKQRRARRENAASSSRSRSGRRANVDRGREKGFEQLWKDHFAKQPMCDAMTFKRQFRMWRPLFVRIVNDLEANYEYFTQITDATGKRGLFPYQKCTVAIRQLAYGVGADEVDEYVCIGESAAMESLKKFCRVSSHFITKNILEDLTRMTSNGYWRVIQPSTGFLACWEVLIVCIRHGKNCSAAWHGQYTRGDHEYPTIMLEAVASHDLWIWHEYFGIAGSNNDINGLNPSPLFIDVVEGYAPPCHFTVNGRQYNQGYYVADGIYPEWSTLVKSFKYPHTDEVKAFKKTSRVSKKDVEKAFGVLQGRWHIIKGPARI
ncbi:uncharacterized protein LOC143625039 [Bidens hawaiensis]|uniref:uncharacterized protein LOC143625039 n=1 Tax=Bidens hawaiensis TaxID=980011 RepID=UPI00404AE4FA